MFIDTGGTAGRHLVDGVAVQARDLFDSKNLPLLQATRSGAARVGLQARPSDIPAKWTDTGWGGLHRAGSLAVRERDGVREGSRGMGEGREGVILIYYKEVLLLKKYILYF